MMELLYDVFIDNLKLVGRSGALVVKRLFQLTPLLVLWSTGGTQAGGEDPSGHQKDQHPGFHHGW